MRLTPSQATRIIPWFISATNKVARRGEVHVGDLSIPTQVVRSSGRIVVRLGPCTYRPRRRTKAFDQRLRSGRLFQRRKTRSGEARVRIPMAQAALALR